MRARESLQSLATILGQLISLAALIYLIYRLATYEGYAQLGEQLRVAGAAGYGALLIALLLMPLPWLIETLRWQTLLRGFADPSLSQAWQQVESGMLAAFITPYRLGEYPARLLQAGIQQPLDWGNWRSWLKDYKKWLLVLLWTLLRYLLWGIQLWCVLVFCGIQLNVTQALPSIALYYLCISLFPSIPIADVATKGGWAVAIFSAYTHNIPQIALAVALIWLINTIIPLFFAYIKKIPYICKLKRKE